MTQLTINIEDKSMLPHLKKVLSAMQGISLAKSEHKRKSGIEEAYDDVRAGRIHRYNSVDDFYKAMGI